MKGKVTHISTAHPVFDTRILLKECRGLRSSGWEVSLIIGAPKNETIEGVKVQAFQKASSRLSRFLFTGWKCFFLALKERADIYQFHDPDFIPFALLLKIVGKRVVYDVHENVPDAIKSKSYIPKPLRLPIAYSLGLLEVICGLTADGFSAATPTIARRFPKSKTKLIQNFPLSSEIAQWQLQSEYIERPKNFLYLGSVGFLRGLQEMVDAFMLLQKEYADVGLIIAGPEGPAESKYLDGLGSPRGLQRLGRVERSKVKSLFEESVAGFVLFHPEPNHVEAQPNKLFEYMSASLPVIASNFPLWRESVEGSQSGLLVDPQDPVEISEAMKKILMCPQEAKQMGLNGRKAVEQAYRWETELEKLEALYDRILQR